MARSTATRRQPKPKTNSEAELWPRVFNDGDALRHLAAINGVNPTPVELVIRFRDEKRPESHPRFWAVLDFSLHSSKNRLFLFDVQDQTVTGYLCAHGRGSEGKKDDGMAEVFSNEDGSNASSLGVYVCSETYYGDHGLSLRLDGQEPTNSNARHRAIVIHGATYVSPEYIKQTGRIGRSKGCPAVEERYAKTIVEALQRGSLLIAWHE
ncbi:MAG TPA: murein L,D-transpeptidase catalytic domain family protein [Bauldia sp.]|nr:murein L,D-transpeptidase catalytic domain family protein [Bauldia sp.]